MKLHWGNALVIFFAIFLGLAATFIVFAVKQNHDLEDKDYYEKGASFSKQIEINKRSIIFTDSILIYQNVQTIVVNFSNYIANSSENMHIHFYRPSNEKFDYQIELKHVDSNFLIDKEKLTKGRYIVKFTWQMNQIDYALKQDLFVE